MRNAKYEIKPPTGVCGDRTEPGIFYDGNDLAWRNGVLSTLVVLICARLWGCLGLLLGGTRNILSTLVFGLSLGLDGSLKRKECLRMFFSVL